jgi:lipopolysaccharide biosynthesis glycosyltransferase
MTISIPVMHCFNNNYAIAAGVAFHSMLENANPNHEYQIYVLHSDISADNQRKLEKTVSKFSNASLNFIDMKDHLSDLFEKTVTKGHYSKEMYYKFLAPSILAEHEKAMIADVDVVYLNDISTNFLDFDIAENYYLAGHSPFCVKGSWLEQLIYAAYKDNFCDEDIRKLCIAGGSYYIFNLKLMRQDNCESKFLEYAASNSHRLAQPEQDTIALVCYPRVKCLPSNSLVCTYLYDLYKTDHDFDNDLSYSSDEIKFALNNPIQLHYATNNKPWKNRDVLKSEIWFEYLAKTPFADDVR